MCQTGQPRSFSRSSASVSSGERENHCSLPIGNVVESLKVSRKAAGPVDKHDLAGGWYPITMPKLGPPGTLVTPIMGSPATW